MGHHPQGLPVLVDSVTKRYVLGDGSVLLASDSASLTVAAGECVALTGTSGSGKSTLLHLVGAVERPDSGKITVGETVVSELKGRAAADYRSTIGFVFQQFHLIPSLTALDNVFAPLAGRTKEKMADCIWLKPELVAQIEFLEWTQDGNLRHTKFVGMRDDKSARDVVR